MNRPQVLQIFGKQKKIIHVPKTLKDYLTVKFERFRKKDILK
jgi:hypothetical protein